MNTYTIEIYSRGIDVGIGKITKEQYEYWSDDDHSTDLDQALNQDYDYEENDAPDNVKFDEYYNEYSDVIFAFGPDMDYHEMTIKDSEGNVVYEGSAEDIISEHDPEYELGMLDTGDRDYYVNDLEPGYYVRWCQGGKGCYFDSSFEAETFDPTKLKFHSKETDYGNILSDISYDGEELSNDAGDYDIKSFESEVVQVEESE